MRHVFGGGWVQSGRLHLLACIVCLFASVVLGAAHSGWVRACAGVRMTTSAAACGLLPISEVTHTIVFLLYLVFIGDSVVLVRLMVLLFSCYLPFVICSSPFSLPFRHSCTICVLCLTARPWFTCSTWTDSLVRRRGALPRSNHICTCSRRARWRRCRSDPPHPRSQNIIKWLELARFAILALPLLEPMLGRADWSAARNGSFHRFATGHVRTCGPPFKK